MDPKKEAELDRLLEMPRKESLKKGAVFAQMSYKGSPAVLIAIPCAFDADFLENIQGVGIKFVKIDAVKVAEVPLLERHERFSEHWANIDNWPKLVIKDYKDKLIKDKADAKAIRAKACKRTTK